MSTTKSKENKSFNIKKGPSKDTLFDALKYAYNKDGARVPVSFEIVSGYTMPPCAPGRAYLRMAVKNFCITGIIHEDGSGESFILTGYCDADTRVIHSQVKYERRRFSAHYNTKRRTGIITIFD